MFQILKAILFGIVEGVTEWLPVSSTGHMILLNEFVKLDVSNEFWKMFLVVIQFGAILAVILLYWKTIWPVRRSKKTGRHYVSRKTIALWIKVIAACIPAAVVGLVLDDWLDEHLYNWWVVAIMLILVGLVFLLGERRNADRQPLVTSLEELTMKDALIIGIFQLLAAVFPGTSRSGATIVGALSIGVSRKIRGIHLYSGDSGDAGGQPSEDYQVFGRGSLLQRHGSGHSFDGNACRLLCIPCDHPLPDGLHPQARF